MSALSLTLLGQFQARLDNQPITDFKTRKVQALLIYVTAEPEEHLRESLMELMWPGMPDRSARHNLRQVLYYLRNAIPDLYPKYDEADDKVPFLITNRQMIQLNPNALVQVDVAQFEALLNEVQAHEHMNVLSCPDCLTSLEKAIELYQGDFLVDFYLDDSNTFEEWAQVTREAYRRQVLDALEVLTAAASQQREFPKAQALAKRQLEIDNLRESVYRQLMEILALSGRREEALAVYEDCRQLLAEELSMEPAKRTTEIAEKIRVGDLSFDTPPAQGVRGYELGEEIGVGTYGAVHRAYQSAVDREVAVKVIRRQFANDPEFIRRFETEAQTVARLEHPYIIPLYDYWRDPDGAYLVMRYLRGGSLLSALESGPWDVNSTGRMLDQIAAALAAAHHQDIIHRDIKPANILLDESGNAYLSDFGIAKELASETNLAAPGPIVGTLNYISPEQIQNQPVSPQTDIYSLGAVLYETLTGEKPFPDSTPANLIYKHLNESVPLVATSQPNIPKQIDVIIQRATAKDPADRYANAQEMAEAFGQSMVGRNSSITVTMPEAFPAVAEVYNPYKGLRAFQEADADDFFGRETLVQQLIDHLADTRFLALVGPSGSGKSSAVKAGLIPALREGAIPGSEKWFMAEMVPGTHPLEELEMALWPIAIDPPPSLVEPMERDNRGLLRTIRRILPNESPSSVSSQLLLVVDQFEELFTQVGDKERRSFFIDSLLQAISAPRSPLRVVITLRADFYDRPLAYETLGQLLKQHTEVVLPLTAEELTWAMREPARRVGVTLERALAEAIVADVTDQAGALPLLQYALTELFERRHERKMTLAAYRDIGGVLGSLSRRAEEIYASLDRAGQESIRQLFLRLVTLGEGVEDTRRRVLQAELESIKTPQSAINGDSSPSAAASQSAVPEIIDALGAARLLTFDHDPVTRQPTVEVAHEALLREWSRLRGWLNESRDDIRQERIVSRAAEEWHQHNRDASYLLHGARLEQVEKWRETTTLSQTPLEQAFITQSLQQREKEEQAEIERQEREAHLEQRSRNFLRGLVAVLAIATVLSGGLGIFALYQQRIAENNAIEAEESAAHAQNVSLIAGSQAALANNDTDTALALAWQAVALNPESALAQAQLSEAAYSPGTVRRFVGDNNLLNHVAVSPDERTMLSAAADHSLILWDIQTGEILRRFEGQTDVVYSVAFSPDGQLAVAGAEDATVILWDVRTGQIRHQFEDYDSRILTISFSPDGQSIIAGGQSENASLIRWDVGSGLVTRRYQEQAHGVREMALTPDGSAILSGDTDGRLILWDAETGEAIRHMEPDSGDGNGGIVSVAIGPDGVHALSGDTLGNMILWNLETGEIMRRIKLGQTWISPVEFMPDGQHAIAARGDINDLLLVDLETGNQVLQLATISSIGQVVPLSDNRRVISASGDGILRLWDLQGGQIMQRFGLSQSDNWEVDRSPDGKIGIVASYDGTAALFDTETGAEIGQFHTDQPIVSVDLSPDGNLAIFGTGYIFEKEEPGHVILWDVATGEEIRRFVGHPLIVWDVEFSPDGGTAVSGGGGGVMILWDVETGQEIRTFQRIEEGELSSAGRILWSPLEIWDVTFSPDGQTIITAYLDGTIILWDVETGQEIRRFLGHTEGAEGVVFSHDGQKALSAGYDNSAILWDVQTGVILRRFTDHTGPVFQTQLSPDDRFLLTGSGDGTTLLWDIETGEVIRRYANAGIYQPVFSPDGQNALVGFRTSAPQLWRIDDTLAELLEWTRANRYIPELTCEQRELYQVEPLCESER